MATLQELVDDLAERLGRPVALEDRRYRVLAYSAHDAPLDRVRLASILAREAPADVVAWLDAEGLQDAEAAVHIPDAPHVGMGPRVAVPVRDGGLLGFLWLVDEGLAAADLAAAESAAAAAAPLIARLRAEERTDHVLVGELLGTDPAARGRAAAALRESGHRGALRVLAGDGVPPAPGIVRGAGVALAFGDADLPAPLPGGAVGASAPRERLDDARDALAEAQAAVALARPGGDAAAPVGGPLVRWERIATYTLLGPLAGAPVPAPLQRLADHRDGPALVATLEAYLDRAGDAAATAAALFVHRTTLYHRLHRIEAIAGVDLRDGDDRLLMHIALRIRRLRGLR